MAFSFPTSAAWRPPFLSLSPLLPVTDDTVAARRNWENTFTSGQTRPGPRPSPSATPATTFLPFNLCSLSHILHTLSWFCCSPHSVSFLPLWWNISPSLSLCHSFTPSESLRIVSSWMPSREENRHPIHEIKYFFFSFWMNYQSTVSYLLLPMISLVSELWILALHQTKLVLCPGKHAHTPPSHLLLSINSCLTTPNPLFHDAYFSTTV